MFACIENLYNCRRRHTQVNFASPINSDASSPRKPRDSICGKETGPAEGHDVHRFSRSSNLPLALLRLSLPGKLGQDGLLCSSKEVGRWTTRYEYLLVGHTVVLVSRGSNFVFTDALVGVNLN